MDVHDQLDQITAAVREAKAMPMSASCLVNRAEMLGALDRLRQALPTDLDQADALLSDRDGVVTAGQAEAELILETARAERERLLEQSDVMVQARERAASVATQARAEATRLLADADDYVDRKLGEFEVVLGQLAGQVSNGRQRLAVRREADLDGVLASGPAPASGPARASGPAPAAAQPAPPSAPPSADQASPQQPPGS